MYKKTTQIPNIILDQYLRTLSASELKVLLVILRQTNGWINPSTGKRKTRDRISYTQFMDKTGYSRRILTKTMKSLQLKGLVSITDRRGQELDSGTTRRGVCLYFSFRDEPFGASTSALLGHEHVHRSAHNKTNYTKLTRTKGEQRSLWREPVKSICELIESLALETIDSVT